MEKNPCASRPGAAAVRQEWQEAWNEKKGSMRDENLATEKSHLAIWLTPPSARMRHGLRLTQLLLGEIEKLSKTNNAPFLLFRTSPPPETHEGLYALNGQQYRASLAQLEENLKTLSDGLRLHVIPIMEKEWRTSAEDSHLNARANKQVLGDLAHAISDLVPDRALAPQGANQFSDKKRFIRVAQPPSAVFPPLT